MYESDREPAGEPVPGGAADDAGLDGDWWRVDPFEEEYAEPSAERLLEVACEREASPDLLVGLARIDVDQLSADDAVTYLQQMQRASAWMAGREAETRAQVTDKVVVEVQALMDQDAETGRPQYVCAEQVAWSEITAALRMSPRTGEARILEAQELTNAWRPLLEAMLAGEITIEHTRAVGRELRNLPGHGNGEPEVEKEYRKSCAKVLAKVVPFALTHTPGETARKTRVLVTAEDPAGARARRRKAAEQDHGVFLNPLEPGTSEIRAMMPTAYAEAIHQAVRMLAKDARFETADGCITNGQRQAAALVALTSVTPAVSRRSPGRSTKPRSTSTSTSSSRSRRSPARPTRVGGSGTPPQPPTRSATCLLRLPSGRPRFAGSSPTRPGASSTPAAATTSPATCRSSSSACATASAAFRGATHLLSAARSTTPPPGTPAGRLTAATSDRSASTTTS